MDQNKNLEIKDSLINRFINEKRAIIQSVYAPQLFVFFGSRTQQTANDQSDIDLLMVSPIFKGTRFRGRMADFLHRMSFPKHIDALCLSPDDFEKSKDDSYMLKEIIRTGIQVKL